MLSSRRHAYLSLVVVNEGPWWELGVADELRLWYVSLSDYCTRSSCGVVSLIGLFCRSYLGLQQSDAGSESVTVGVATSFVRWFIMQALYSFPNAVAGAVGIQE